MQNQRSLAVEMNIRRSTDNPVAFVYRDGNVNVNVVTTNLAIEAIGKIVLLHLHATLVERRGLSYWWTMPSDAIRGLLETKLERGEI
jgi:hypothetical protein